MNETYNLISVADMHTNSTVSVAPPMVHLDDGGTYHASRGQRWLWECWLDFCKQVSELQGRKILVIGGDLGELDTKRRSNQLITTNKATIQTIVIDTLAPLVDIVDGVIFIRGTMAHTGKSQWLEEAIAQDCTTAIKANGTASWYHFRGYIGSARFDIAHHAPMGGIPANSAAKLAANAEAYYHKKRQPLPHIVQRSHNHRYADSGGNYETFAVFTPSWSLMTEYAYRMGKEYCIADIGGLIYNIRDGHVDTRKVFYESKEDKKLWSIRV